MFLEVQTHQAQPQHIISEKKLGEAVELMLADENLSSREFPDIPARSDTPSLDRVVFHMPSGPSQEVRSSLSFDSYALFITFSDCGSLA
jgi:hypothetical protein